MTCSEYLVDFLINHGVTDVFGYAGGYIVPFMDALYKRKDEITTHVCYHEQGWHSVRHWQILCAWQP